MSNDIIEFDLPKASPSIIMVTGVGGGGSNAVNHMYEMGITDVTFMVCNTDKQALSRSAVPVKVRLGSEGLGAGNRPEKGREAALDNIEDVKDIFRENGTRMVFITAGMGGGTGTGAAPVIAKAAKDMGILTVAIVTIPFRSEGPKRINQAIVGIQEIKDSVDSLLIVNNENIQEIYGKLTLSEAFGKADDILATAAKGIAEIITEDYYINVDFADVETVMRDSGIALMGSARGSGDDRAISVTEEALSSPLLNHKDIKGAKNILLNIRSGETEVTMDELYQITEYIQKRTGTGADLIWGAGRDETLGDDISVTIVATGFEITSEEDLYALEFGSTVQKVISEMKDQAELTTECASESTTDEQEIDVVIEIDNTPEDKEIVEPAFKLGVNTGLVEQIVVEEIDIDELEKTPAYLRRKVTNQTIAPEGGKASRIVFRDDSAVKERSSGLLFGEE